MLPIFPTFPRHLPLGNYETVAGLLSRHAAQLGIPGGATICTDLGVRWSDLLAGNHTLIVSLAKAANVSLDDLVRWSPVRTSEGFSVGHETLPKYALSRRHARFCPLCLEDDLIRFPARPDLAVFGRSHWHIQCLPICETHKIALIEPNSAIADHLRTDFTLWIEPVLRELDTWLRQVMPCTPSDCDAYLFARLRGNAYSIQLLDDLPLPLVARACEELGQKLIPLSDPHMPGDDVHTQQKVRQYGFGVFAGGPRELWTYFDDRLREAGSDKRSANGLVSLYGHFCKWLTRQTEPCLDPIRDVLADHAFANLPLAAGSVVCQRVLQARRRHTIRTAAKDFGSRIPMMRTWLLAEEILPASPSQPAKNAMIPDTPAAAAFLDKVKYAITYKQAGRYLKISLDQLDNLIADGIVRPLFENTIENAENAYSRTQLASLMSRLISNRSNEPMPWNADIACMRVTEIAPFVHCSFSDIIRLLLSKQKVRIFIEPNASGIEAIFLWKEDVENCISSPDFPGLTPARFALKLQINYRHMEKLKQDGLIYTKRIKHPYFDYSINLVSYECMLDFESKYISLDKLAAMSRRHWIAQYRYLNARKCYPVYDGASPKSRFYRYDSNIMYFPNLKR